METGKLALPIYMVPVTGSVFEEVINKLKSE